MFIKKLVVGLLQTNCYILSDDKTKEAVIIDPGGGGKKILKIIKDSGLNVKYIINTHGHIDHTFENRKIKEKTGALLLIHKYEVGLLTGSKDIFSSFVSKLFRTIVGVDRLLTDGDKIKLGNLILEILHTPGHTKGSICIKVNDVLFSGDTIFKSSVGRTDLIGGSMTELLNSIKNKILPLPDDTIIHPGHGPSTTLGKEKQFNPFISNM